MATQLSTRLEKLLAWLGSNRARLFAVRNNVRCDCCLSLVARAARSLSHFLHFYFFLVHARYTRSFSLRVNWFFSSLLFYVVGFCQCSCVSSSFILSTSSSSKVATTAATSAASSSSSLLLSMRTKGVCLDNLEKQLRQNGIVWSNVQFRLCDNIFCNFYVN